MDRAISTVTKVEIEGLWGRFDLAWELHPDVNVLSGINGSGKSTILECIGVVLKTRLVLGKLSNVIWNIKVTFDSGKLLSAEYSEGFQGWGRNGYLEVEGELRRLRMDIINTFDKVIPEAGNRPDESVRTELDRDIFKLQKRYLDYQLNMGKKLFEVIRKNNGGSDEEVLKIGKQRERFLEMIDHLFEHTGKKIDRDKNELVFISGENEITAYQLSSGEKQILVILLTALIQDNKPTIMLMDEPEISLHFDWQKKLIGYIRELNPNAQLILATHSPALIMEGWSDKVFDVRDLIVNDRRKTEQ